MFSRAEPDVEAVEDPGAAGDGKEVSAKGTATDGNSYFLICLSAL